MPLRRGVSEVYAAVLVALVAAASIAAGLALMGDAVRGAVEAGEWVARVAADSAAPTIIIPYTSNGDLWVSVESVGARIREIVVVDPSGGGILSRVPVGGAASYEGPVLRGYDCREVAILAITVSGAVKAYDARVDPRFGGAAGSPYFSCELESLASPPGGAEAARGGGSSWIVNAGPGPGLPGISWRPLGASLTVEASVEVGDSACRVPEARINGVSLRADGVEYWPLLVAENHRIMAAATPWVEVADSVEARLVLWCSPSAGHSLLVLEFARDGAPLPVRIRGSVEASGLLESASKEPTAEVGAPPPVTPLVWAPGGESTASVVIVKYRSAGESTVSAAASGGGDAETGRVVLLASRWSEPYELHVKASIEVLEYSPTGWGAEAEVPLGTGRLAVVLYRTYYSDPSLVLPVRPTLLAAAMEEGTVRVSVRLHTEQGTVDAPLSPGLGRSGPRAGVRVPEGVQASLVVQRAQCDPLTEAPRVASVQELYSTLRYKVELAPLPTPIGACKPVIVKVKAYGNQPGKLVAVEPYRGAPDLVYLSAGWEALAPVVSGASLPGDTVPARIYTGLLYTSIPWIWIRVDPAQLEPWSLPPGTFFLAAHPDDQRALIAGLTG